MINSLQLKNFRNFSERTFTFDSEKNIIIWKNGHGKSNILEALSLPAWGLVEGAHEYLLKKWEESFYVSYDLHHWKHAMSYLVQWQKKYFIESKSTTKAKLRESYPHVISFHPMMMNMMYLWPSERRQFLDEMTLKAFPAYKKIFSEFKKVLQNRNKLLRNISEKKSDISELSFWDEKYINLATEVYAYRRKSIDFLSEKSPVLKEYFFWKVDTLTFSYISKLNLHNIEEDIREYISKNKEKEILLRKTLRWPHLDDFDILVDNTSLIHFASRWEVKSIILWLKFLESTFIENTSKKQEVLFLIDDLLSELDNDHRNMLWSHIGERQCVISSIEDLEISGNKIFL